MVGVSAGKAPPNESAGERGNNQAMLAELGDQAERRASQLGREEKIGIIEAHTCA